MKDARAAYWVSDFAEAVRILRPIAEQGNAEAQLFLGGMYLTGKSRRDRYSHTVVSVPKDYAEAARLYRLAAGQGNAVAPNNLGIMYQEGLGVPQDYVEAVKWYRLSAEQGHAKAPYNLGFMYQLGLGVPQDYVLALMWYTLAASYAVDSRGYVAKEMTPDQIAEAQQLARDWIAAHPQ